MSGRSIRQKHSKRKYFNITPIYVMLNSLIYNFLRTILILQDGKKLYLELHNPSKV